MRRFFGFWLLAALSLAAWPSRADDGPWDIRYALVSYDWWPVFIFYRVAPAGQVEPAEYLMEASNGGWDSSLGSAPIRNAPDEADRFEVIGFDLIWREEVTQRVYQARLDIPLRDLKRDPISAEMGTLILRFARGGDLQAVTYEPHMQPGAMPPIEIAHVCGTSAEITHPAQLEELERLSEYWKTEGAYDGVQPETVPSRCE